jgi:hypothetical protein
VSQFVFIFFGVLLVVLLYFVWRMASIDIEIGKPDPKDYPYGIKYKVPSRRGSQMTCPYCQTMQKKSSTGRCAYCGGKVK